MTGTDVRITRINAFAFRCPIAEPVATSFGIMRDRPAVFLRVEDGDGAFGWGEVFANWPSAGAEHRVRLLAQDIAPLILGQSVAGPEDLFYRLDAQTRIRALQCGEEGPFRQVIAGLDIALWDLFARRAGSPVRQLIAPGAADAVPTYASGIDIRAAGDRIAAARESGFSVFKVKVGFDFDSDVRATLDLADGLEGGELLCADANQAWDAETARAFLEETGTARLHWMEEPLPADAPRRQWAELARATSVDLAGGENVVGFSGFDDVIAAGGLRVIQPDVVKWGGLTGCLKVARQAIAAGRRYCPHYLGGGIGLAASAELLAAVGGDGRLEVDVNPNPLREAFAFAGRHGEKGRFNCSNRPGFGIADLPEELSAYRTLRREMTAA